VFDFYQYWLNVDDRDVVRLMKLFTWMPLDEIEGFAGISGADLREVKHRLALEVTTILHGADAAQTAAAAARAMAAGAATDDLPTHVVARDALAAGVLFANVLRDAGLAASTSEARRLLDGGGVKLDQGKVEDAKATLTAAQLPEGGAVLRVGKSKAVRLLPG
jgi:tyrosyl-tRNA synthetase